MPAKKKLQKVQETYDEIFQEMTQKQFQTSQVVKNVQQEEQEEEHEILLPLNEPKFDMLNKYWKLRNKNIEEYINFNETKYLVDKNIFLMSISQLEKQKYEKVDESYKIYKFYRLSDNNGNTSDIMTTLNTIYGCFCADLLNNVKGESNHSKFDGFTKSGSNKIYVTILKVIRTKLTKGIREELDLIKKELNEQNGFILQTKNIEKDKTIEMMIKKIKIMTGTVDIPIQKFYIYKIYSVSDPTKSFIHGSTSILKITDLKQIIENECVSFIDLNLKATLLKDIEIQLSVEGMLYIDEQIKILDTIKNGHNKYYNILHNNDINKAIFMYTQYDLLYYKYADLNVGNDGYIAKLQIGDTCYIYFGFDKNVVTKLRYFYLMTNHNTNENKKIVDLLAVTKANEVNVEILKRNVNKENINNELITILNKFEKDKILNYEEFNYVDQKDFKKEISGVKSLVFMSKYKK